MHVREYVLKEFWQLFVDDRPSESDAIGKHACERSKAVFSYAMTVMNTIFMVGKKKKSGWVQNLRHACGSTLHACSARDESPRRKRRNT